MAGIHILDDVTVDKIAAGEVVERPASVIKELVENSIDAKATKIEVEIIAGGTSFMRVTDNGEGMDNKNARLAILRHATSKLQRVDDLLSINTLGFRGEALPSIAAVSRFLLLTRQCDADLGTSIKLTGGTIDEIDDAGANIGTTIKVEDLFFNVPARKKFLKTTTTEANKINDFMIKLAFSRPDIAFKLINNNKMNISTPGNGSLYDVVESIYGSKVSTELLPVEFNDEGIKIQGFITKPAVIRSSRSWQTTLINGRVITSRVIFKAIDNAYHSLLPKSGYPLVVFNIELDPRTIDVNVHPQKADVKFEDEGRIFKAVYAAVSAAIKPADQNRNLQEFAAPLVNSIMQRAETVGSTATNPINSSGHAPQQLRMDWEYAPPSSQKLQDFREVRESLANPQFTTKELTPANAMSTLADATRENDYATTNIKPVESYISDEVVAEESLFKIAAELIPLGQIDKCFIVAQGPQGGMFLIDQHAAHERILYDRFGKQTERIAMQQLLVHLFVDVNGDEAELVENYQQNLWDLGFDVELAGERQLRLKGIPADINSGLAEEVLREILKALNNLHRPTPQEIRHSCLAMTACKAAIKAGDVLSLAQIRVILQELANTTLPYTCPHGRPTIIKFTSYDLEKMFKRIQ